MNENIFTAFRNEVVYKTDSNITHYKAYIMMFFDKNNNAYIDVVDSKKNVINFDPMDFHGINRQILQNIQNIKENNNLSFDWIEDDRKIYLIKYPHLINDLIKCELFSDESFNKIEFKNDYVVLKLFIQQDITITDCTFYQSKLQAQIGDELFSDFSFINIDYLLIKNNLYKTLPVGQNFNRLHLLNYSFIHIELEKFLSLFYSHFNNIKLVFNNYKVKYLKPKNVSPCLIISNIDKRNFLHLKLSCCLMNFKPDFFEYNNFKKIAQINDLDTCIEVSELFYFNYENVKDDIENLLNRYGKNVKNLIKWFFEDNAKTFVISP